MDYEKTMDTCMMVAIEDLHVKLTEMKAFNIRTEYAIRFEKGCIHSLKSLLGYSTLLYASPYDRIRKRVNNGVNIPLPKDISTTLCVELHTRLQNETSTRADLTDKLKELLKERELLEYEYYNHVDL